MKHDILIRNIKKEDIPAVANIRINGWKTAYKGIIEDDYLDKLSVENDIIKRSKDYKQNGFIVAEQDKKVVGFCRYINSNEYTTDVTGVDCELTAIYVDSNLKYKGIGTKLFEHVIKEFKKKKKKKMILWCLKDNEPSKKFYTKLGGKVIAEKKVFVGTKSYNELGFCYDIEEKK